MIRWTSLAITTDALGAGTATTAGPVIGHIYEVRNNALSYSATADFTITRDGPAGGTILAVTNQNGPFTFCPRFDAVTPANVGGSAVAMIPSNDYVKCVVAQGGSVQAGTIHLYYCD